MSSVKYAEDSPYKLPKPSPNEADFKYSQYLDSLSARIEEGDRLYVAVFGLGRAGIIHLRNVLSDYRLKLLYIVEIDTDRLKKIQEKFKLEDNVVVHLDDAEKVFQDTRLDCTIIATPTASHERLVLQALKSGKAVLCEKPLSEGKEGIRRCYDLAQKNGAPLLCAFNREFDPALKSIRDQVHNGKVGQVYVIKSAARDSPLPSIEYLKTSGGIYHDCAVHDIDMVCWILGEYPSEVFAMGHAFTPEIKAINDVDTTVFSMKFPSGALGQVDLSRNSLYGYDQRVEVFGSKGMLLSGNQLPTQVSHFSEKGETTTPMFYSFPSRYEESYKQELNHLCDVIKGKAEISITCENTLKVTEIAIALQESLQTGKTVHIKY